MNETGHQVARDAIRDLIALADERSQRATVMRWLDGEEPHMRRGLWVCEVVFSQAMRGGLDGRSLLTCTLYALLLTTRPRQIKLMALARALHLELTRASLLAALLPAKSSNTTTDGAYVTSTSGRALTLGERRALARRPSAKSIEQLLHDPDPIVLKHLLQNPRLTELLVLRVVTYRPQSPHTLLAVFAHVDWGKRDQVRRALALNPDTPLPIRCALLSHLTLDDLASVEREPQLPPLLQAALRRAQRAMNY